MLHPNAREILRQKLVEALQHITVKNRYTVEPASAFFSLYQANSSIPQNGNLRDRINEWVGEYPIINFVSDEITRILRNSGVFELEPESCPLSAIEQFSNIEQTADSIVKSFESLPWTYTLTVELPSSLLPGLSEGASEVVVGPRTFVAKSDLYMNNTYPLTHSNPEVIKRAIGGGGLLSIFDPEKENNWSTEKSFLRTEVDGFIGPYSLRAQDRVVTRRLRSFFGLGLALGLFSKASSYAPYPPRNHWVVHKKEEGSWVLHDRSEFDSDDSSVIASLQLWDKFQTTYPLSQRQPWLCSIMSSIGKILCSDNSATLALAAQWFFDSFKRSDEVLSYVRCMVCLEILFGEKADSSKLSLGDLIGNRLAYLVGKNHSDRLSVLQDFRQIYGVRSKILHNGKDRLEGSDRVLLMRLRKLCESALRSEAKLLFPDARMLDDS